MIDEVFHSTFLKMDEDGTEAAAATATMMMMRNGLPREIPHKVVTADHPFIFLIQDVRNGACLFIGRIIDPAPEKPLSSLPVREESRAPSK
jgi:serpin B